MTERAYALIDFDSTLGQLMPAMIGCCNHAFETQYRSSDIDSWGWWTTHTEDEHAAYVWGDDVFNNEEFTLSIPPLPNAVEGVWAVANKFGLKPVVVSDRSEHHGAWIEAWLRKWGLEWVPVEITNGVTRPKAEVAWEYKMRLAVDDSPHNAWALANVPCIYRVYMPHYRYNDHVPEHPIIKRVQGWKEIITDRHPYAMMSEIDAVFLSKTHVGGDKNACMPVDEMDGHPGNFEFRGRPYDIMSCAYTALEMDGYRQTCGTRNCVNNAHMEEMVEIYA